MAEYQEYELIYIIIWLQEEEGNLSDHFRNDLCWTLSSFLS